MSGSVYLCTMQREKKRHKVQQWRYKLFLLHYSLKVDVLYVRKPQHNYTLKRFSFSIQTRFWWHFDLFYHWYTKYFHCFQRYTNNASEYARHICLAWAMWMSWRTTPWNGRFTDYIRQFLREERHTCDGWKEFGLVIVIITLARQKSTFSRDLEAYFLLIWVA
jgi:hypothetical protein